MIFYRIKKEFDGFHSGGFRELVRNELYTRREMEMFRIPIQWAEMVKEKSRSIYWFFGARFGSLGYND